MVEGQGALQGKSACALGGSSHVPTNMLQAKQCSKQQGGLAHGSREMSHGRHRRLEVNKYAGWTVPGVYTDVSSSFPECSFTVQSKFTSFKKYKGIISRESLERKRDGVSPM